MSEHTYTENGCAAQSNNSCLQRALLIILIIFFLSASAVSILFVTGIIQLRQGIQRLSEATNPISDFARNLFVEATPVILPSPVTILRSVQDEARLLTLTADFQTNVIAERRNEVLWGLLGEQLIFEAHGTVAAGIDLTQLQEEDILVVSPDTVWIRLPRAIIFEDLPILDTQKSRVLDRDTGLFTRADPNLETQVRRDAEKALLEAAQASNLLQKAEQNAQIELRRILAGLGFVQVVFYEDTFPPVTPYAQQVPKGFTIVTTPEP